MSYFTTNFGFGTTAVLPVQTPTGGAVPLTFHIVVGTVSISLDGFGNGHASVTLSGTSVFTSATSYSVFPMFGESAPASSNATLSVAATSGAVFVVYANGATNYASTTITVPFVAIGY